jgi:DNA topoisomerase IB
MRIRVVSSKEEIESLSKEKIIHIAFRPSNKDIFTLVQKCSDVKAIQIPPSYLKTISDSTKMFLELQDISLLEGDVWGHRKDINEYYEINPEVFDSIEQLKEQGLSEADVFNRMERDSGLSKDLLKFLVKGKGGNPKK